MSAAVHPRPLWITASPTSALVWCPIKAANQDACYLFVGGRPNQGTPAEVLSRAHANKTHKYRLWKRTKKKEIGSKKNNLFGSPASVTSGYTGTQSRRKPRKRCAKNQEKLPYDETLSVTRKDDLTLWCSLLYDCWWYYVWIASTWDNMMKSFVIDVYA